MALNQLRKMAQAPESRKIVPASAGGFNVAPVAPEDGTCASATVTTAYEVTRSSTSSSCWRAAFPMVRTAECLLRYTPALHPIGKSLIAIVRLGRRDAPTALIRTALAMNPATPLLLRDRPACLPIRESVLAIVRVCWGRRLRGLATNMMHSAAPLLFRTIPRKILADSAIVGIDRPHRSRRRGDRWHERPRWRPRWGRRWRRRGRRRGRRRREWRWRYCGRRLWQSSRSATPANSHAAVVFLRLGPSPLDECVIPAQEQASLAIVRQRSGLARQEPQ